MFFIIAILVGIIAYLTQDYIEEMGKTVWCGWMIMFVVFFGMIFSWV